MSKIVKKSSWNYENVGGFYDLISKNSKFQRSQSFLWVIKRFYSCDGFSRSFKLFE